MKDFSFFFENQQPLLFFKEVLNLKISLEKNWISSFYLADDDNSRLLIKLKILYLKNFLILLEKYFNDQKFLENHPEFYVFFVGFLKEAIEHLFIAMLDYKIVIEIINGKVV